MHIDTRSLTNSGPLGRPASKSDGWRVPRLPVMSRARGGVQDQIIRAARLASERRPPQPKQQAQPRQQQKAEAQRPAQDQVALSTNAVRIRKRRILEPRKDKNSLLAARQDRPAPVLAKNFCAAIDYAWSNDAMRSGRPADAWLKNYLAKSK